MGAPGTHLPRLTSSSESNFLKGFMLFTLTSLNFGSFGFVVSLVELSAKAKTTLMSLALKSSPVPPSTPIHSLPILSSYKMAANFDLFAFSNLSPPFLFFLSFFSSPSIIIFSGFTFSSLNDVDIIFALPPLFAFSILEAKVMTTFVSMRKHVKYSS